MLEQWFIASAIVITLVVLFYFTTEEPREPWDRW